MVVLDKPVGLELALIYYELWMGWTMGALVANDWLGIRLDKPGCLELAYYKL